MKTAEKCLAGVAFSISQADLGLEKQFQPIVIQGVSEQVGDFLIMDQPVVDVGGIETHAVLAGFFGLVHGRVCIAHQLGHGGAIMREKTHAEAGGNLVTIALQMHSVFQSVYQPTNKFVNTFRAFEIEDQQDKLVPAKAAQQVSASKFGPQSFGHRFQETVTMMMATGIVDDFEIVQIDKNDR